MYNATATNKDRFSIILEVLKEVRVRSCSFQVSVFFLATFIGMLVFYLRFDKQHSFFNAMPRTCLYPFLMAILAITPKRSINALGGSTLYKVAAKDATLNSDQRLFQVYSIPTQVACVLQCHKVPRCASVNWSREQQLCELNWGFVQDPVNLPNLQGTNVFQKDSVFLCDHLSGEDFPLTCPVKLYNKHFKDQCVLYNAVSSGLISGDCTLGTELVLERIDASHVRLKIPTHNVCLGLDDNSWLLKVVECGSASSWQVLGLGNGKYNLKANGYCMVMFSNSQDIGYYYCDSSYEDQQWYIVPV